MINAEATLIVLRESLEAFLIVSIFTGLVVKFGRPAGKRVLLAGAGAGLAATVLVGLLTDAAAREMMEASGAEPLFAAFAALVAVALLTYMIVWMYRHTLHLIAEMRRKAVGALEVGKPIVLFTLAFAAISREGLETILFFATLAPTTDATTLLLSALVGFAASAVLAFVVFTGIVRLSIQRFFAVSGLLLVLFAGGLLAGAIHGFAEAGWVDPGAPVWSTKGVLDEDSVAGGILNALVGYRDAPTVPEVLAYAAYALGVGAWYVRGVRMHARGAAQPVEA